MGFSYYVQIKRNGKWQRQHKFSSMILAYAYFRQCKTDWHNECIVLDHLHHANPDLPEHAVTCIA